MNGNLVRIRLFADVLRAAAGLAICSVGMYLMILAGIGVQPRDTLCIGLSGRLDIQYGTVSVMLSAVLLVTDLLLRERIGVGTVLDALMVGKLVDLLNWFNLLSRPATTLGCVGMLLAGLVIQSVGQSFYMRSALGCGPRDGLLVGLGRHTHLPIGVVQTIVMLAELVSGWLLGGSIGVGTVVCTLGCGPILQGVFRCLRFDSSSVCHRDLLAAARILYSGIPAEASDKAANGI